MNEKVGGACSLSYIGGVAGVTVSLLFFQLSSFKSTYLTIAWYTCRIHFDPYYYLYLIDICD